MSYTDQHKRLSPASIGTVVIVHAAIGYAFISGLAMRVIQTVPVVTAAVLMDDQADPPPNMPPPPQTRQADTPRPTTVDRIVDVPLTTTDPVIVALPPTQPTVPDFRPVETVTPPPPQPSLARGAQPASSRASWVTNDDYPPQALRENVEGSVGIDVAIGADGRVTACTVTTSSGNDLLDQASCRLYSRRARFAPALDEAGKPVASHRADRLKWQIPQ